MGWSMASKNPVKGFVRCHMPNCGQVATVHAVGEHRIITEGNPPRNKRNTGRLYYNCPSCGFQQGKGEAFQTFITASMQPSREALNAVSEPAPMPAVIPKPKPVEAVKHDTVTQEPAPPKPNPSRLEAVKPYLLALVALVTLFLMFQPKKDTQAHGKPNNASA